jgi:hypothetical protein
MRYYVSEFDQRTIRRFAPTLDVTLGEDEFVVGWTFLDHDGQSTLPIRETVGQADAWRKRRCDETPRIVLAEVIHIGKSTPDDLASALGPPHQITQINSSQRELWSYYVLEPSPVRKLAFSLDIYVDEDTNIARRWMFSGQHGCGAL